MDNNLIDNCNGQYNGQQLSGRYHRQQLATKWAISTDIQIDKNFKLMDSISGQLDGQL